MQRFKILPILHCHVNNSDISIDLLLITVESLPYVYSNCYLIPQYQNEKKKQKKNAAIFTDCELNNFNRSDYKEQCGREE